MTTTDVILRRRKIFQYWAQGLTPDQMHDLLSDSGLRGCSLVNIKRDVRQMPDWIPSLTQTAVDPEDVQKVVGELRAKIQLAQGRMTQVMFSGDSSSAQVGAADKYMKLVGKELELLTRAGLIKPPELKITQEVQADVRQWDIAEIFSEYGEVFLQDALRRQLQADRRHTEAVLSESLDPEDE